MKDKHVLEQKNSPHFLSTFLNFPEALMITILQVTEAPSPEAEASTALIAGNEGSEPNPGSLLRSELSHSTARSPVW